MTKIILLLLCLLLSSCAQSQSESVQKFENAGQDSKDLVESTENNKLNIESNQNTESEQLKDKEPQSNGIEMSKEIGTRPNEMHSSIVIKYGQLGEYGKKTEYDGETYYEYKIPIGKYVAKNLSNRIAIVFVESDVMYKNSDGYWENDVIERVDLKKSNDSKVVNIPENSHITLSINSEVEFLKID